MKNSRLVWRLITYRPWLYLANALAWTAIHTLPVLPGLISKAFFDSLPEEAAGLGIWTIVALLSGVALTRICCIVLGALADSKHRFSMSALLRHNMFQAILRRPGSQSIPCSPGEAVSYFREDAEAAEDVISWTVDMIGNIAFCLVAVLVMIRISPRITLYVFLPLVAVMVVFARATHRIEAYREASREASTKVTGFIGEAFSSVQAVQVARSEQQVIGHLRQLNDQRRLLFLKDRAFNLLLDSISSSTVWIGTGFILILASQAMQRGDFSVGDFALFAYYLDWVTGASEFFGYFLARFKQTAVSFDRMLEVAPGSTHADLVAHNQLHLEGALPAVEPTAVGNDRLRELTVRDLHFHYPGSTKGIQGVSLCVRQGQFVVITGRIGSGKTTLLRVILGLVARESGDILWNGQQVADPGSFLVPPKVAFTSQIPMLFSDTVQGNILLGQNAEQIDLASAVHTAVLEADLEQLEMGLRTLVGSRGVKLSGGQVQRVAAARMFAQNADLMVFDDLSSALDVETEQLMWERVFARQQAACLVVSHRRAALKRADHIIVLKDGKVIDEGNLVDLLRRCDEMRLLWRGDRAGNEQGVGAMRLEITGASN